ncbi:hypothetical protein SLE2022_019710 [Rubroshorea leprosula]
MNGNGGYNPLFETKRPKGIAIYRLFALSVFFCICLVWTYRATQLPTNGEEGRWVWIGLFAAELWFGFYWILTQSLRWNPIYRRTFKDRLSKRHDEGNLPGVDIFVCTADPEMEPPIMVINTVLSVMAYDYPPEKLAIYLSDDAGSEITFYALLEASKFAKHWIPFCKKFSVDPRSPAAYFTSSLDTENAAFPGESAAIKKMYEEMKNRIVTASRVGRISEELRSTQEGFLQWNSYTSRRDHDTILQILIDGKDPNAMDIEGNVLPTLVYLAREKRPQYHHNFKAGAMNALIRVSSKISKGEIILNVDCDMYSNNAQAIRDALCFFLDEEKGPEIAFVQFPQIFDNITKNEIYSGSMRVIREVEFHGLDGYGGPCYIGTGCFHRRETLTGKIFNNENRSVVHIEKDRERSESTLHELQETAKGLAHCTYEQNTQWGKEIGLKYGCPVEDVITGLSIQCQGWKSVYYNPARKAFLGVAATTLPQALVQHKRWSEGDLQILLSKFSPAWYANGRISLGLQLGYCCYCFWSVNSIPVLYYSIVPSLYLLKGVALFPKCSSPWFIPFAYVIFSKFVASLVEFLFSGGTIKGWWNDQRIWLYKRTASYLFALIDTISKTLGFSETTFVISAKVSDQDVSNRYKKEMMEFGDSSPMSTILATIALINLFCLVGAVMKKVGLDEKMFVQSLLCVVLVLINIPLYQGLFFREDKGKIPKNVTIKSVVLALSMKMGSAAVVLALILALLPNVKPVLAIRIFMQGEECLSYDVKYTGDTLLVSFVVVKYESSWQKDQQVVDLVVNGPSGEQIIDFRDRVSEKFEFVSHEKGLHRFCFFNKSPYYETIDFEVQENHFTVYDEHAKDEHFNPLLEQISKLESAIHNIHFEQHWLIVENERKRIVTQAMSKRAVHKAFFESAALIGACILQVYLLRRLFNRKLRMSRV